MRDGKDPALRRVGFVRFRRILIAAPFVMPLLTLACVTVAMRHVEGMPYALYVLGVVSIAWLAVRCVRLHFELKTCGGSRGVGSVDLVTSLAASVSKSVEKGMAPDDAISTAMGFAIGICMGHFAWTPRQVRDVAFQTAEELAARQRAQQ